MRVVDIRPGHEAEDIQYGRGALAAEIQHPAKTVMIIRGASPQISHFADKANARCAPFPWRSAVWLMDPRIFSARQEEEWFADHAESCAVILDLKDDPASWLAETASAYDIEMAWLNAEGK
jgi:hypothetical protein